jgi:hypothetical protein
MAFQNKAVAYPISFRAATHAIAMFAANRLFLVLRGTAGEWKMPPQSPDDILVSHFVEFRKGVTAAD